MTKESAPREEGWVVSRANHFRRGAPYALLIVIVIAISSPSLMSRRIDDVDSAHHIMDGMFVRDFIADMPHSLTHPVAYTLAYYRQYPALGFLVWPPLFPAMEGVFFLSFGQLDVRIARVCILGFGMVLACCAYAVLRKELPKWYSVAAVLLVLATPAIASFYQQVMLEIPALAAVMITVLVYKRTVTREIPRWRDYGLLVLAAAAAVYTKQTCVFAFGAVLTDLCINHRRILRDRRFWASLAVFAALLAPLAIFTVTFGYANIEQSVGSDKTYVLNSNAPPDRWSVQAWVFYLMKLPGMIHPVLVILGAAAIVYALLNREFFRSHALWFGWLASWYLLFSYFLNKQVRYAVFWLPGWIVLAVAILAELFAKYRWRREFAAVVLALPCIAGAIGISKINIDGFDGVDVALRQVVNDQPGGNILYLGAFPQILAPFIREYDGTRRAHLLRGLDLLSSTPDIESVCRDYRVRLVVTGDENSLAVKAVEELQSRGEAVPIGGFKIQTGHKSFTLRSFEYRGPLAESMRDVPIGSGRIGHNAAALLNH